MTTIKSNAPKPYVVLTTVKSESGSWEYEIRTSLRDGKTYCTCKGFTFNKKCKHMDAHRKNPQIAVVLPAMDAKQAARTPGAVLVEELRMLGLTISPASANAISVRVLAAAGKQAAGSTSFADTINAANYRVIVLPD